MLGFRNDDPSQVPENLSGLELPVSTNAQLQIADAFADFAILDSA